MNTTILASQKYPSPFHAYPPDNIVDVTQPNNVATTSIEVASVQQANITRAQIGGAPGVVGFFGSVQYCKLLSGANERGFAVIAFDALGVPTEIDLYDGRGSGNVLGAPALSTITQIQTRALPYTGAWGAPVAVPANTIEVYDDFNAPAGILATETMFTDLGMNNQTASQAVVETNVGVEQCVQRWDVANTGTQVILAVSSTSAATFSGPNGDPPLGYVSPFGRSSYFEVYGYTSGTNRYDLNSYTTTTSPVVARALWCAMGGPWRMIGGLVKLDYLNRYACVLMPAGDDFQQSAFMVSFVNGSATVETTLLSTDKTTVMTAENVVYKNNQGVFVESLNRVLGDEVVKAATWPRAPTVNDTVDTDRSGVAGGCPHLKMLQVMASIVALLETTRVLRWTASNRDQPRLGVTGTGAGTDGRAPGSGRCPTNLPHVELVANVRASIKPCASAIPRLLCRLRRLILPEPDPDCT